MTSNGDSQSVDKPDLRKDLASLLNRWNREAGSDTPDFILAELLLDVLCAFEEAVNRRDRWYGRPHNICQEDETFGNTSKQQGGDFPAPPVTEEEDTHGR